MQWPINAIASLRKQVPVPPGHTCLVLDEIIQEPCAEQLLAETVIAAMGARKAVNHALEVGLRDGLLFKRRVYHALWATADVHEGMAAFVEKRPPVFRDG